MFFSLVIRFGILVMPFSTQEEMSTFLDYNSPPGRLATFFIQMVYPNAHRHTVTEAMNPMISEAKASGMA